MSLLSYNLSFGIILICYFESTNNFHENYFKQVKTMQKEIVNDRITMKSYGKKKNFFHKLNYFPWIYCLSIRIEFAWRYCCIYNSKHKFANENEGIHMIALFALLSLSLLLCQNIGKNNKKIICKMHCNCHKLWNGNVKNEKKGK